MSALIRSLVGVCCIGWSTNAWAVATIQGVGDLPGGAHVSLVNGVSADGSTAYGVSDDGSTAGGAAFRWTEAGGIEALATNPDDPSGTEAVGATADGVVIAVRSTHEWFFWGEGLGRLFRVDDGTVSGLSADGVACGMSATGAFRWTERDGAVPLTPLGGYGTAIAHAISADGDFIVGSSSGIGVPDGGIHAVRWNEAGVAEDLGDLPGGQIEATAYDVSADGSVVVGVASVERVGVNPPFTSEAFRWTEATGMQGLGFLGVLYYGSEAETVSPDGVLIFGRSHRNYGSDPFVWDATNGMRSLEAVLEDEHGLDTTGWYLERVTGISADRRTLVGNGMRYLSPPGSSQIQWVQEGFVVRLSTPLPEPGAATLSGVAIAALVALRRRARGVAIAAAACAAMLLAGAASA